MEPTQKHLWQKLLYPAATIVVIGIVAYVVATSGKGKPVDTAPLPSAQAPQGGSVTISVPKDTVLPKNISATFFDAGEHGFIAIKSGGGVYMTYDPTTDLSYKATARVETTPSDQRVTVDVPDGVCGYIVKSDLEPNPKPKIVTLSLIGSDGKPIPGTETPVAIKCDTYTLSVKTRSTKDPVLPDGADQSKITATLSVTGPAQYVNGQKVKPGSQKITVTTPLGLIYVNFTTDLGVLAPSPSKLKTDLAGEASVTITSVDAGIASVRAAALSVGDAKEQIHFKPKIVAVKMDFVEPNSPTNYELKTIPANPADLDLAWRFVYAGPPCGKLTGILQAKGITKNSFYHGPAKGFPDGCPVPNEQASRVVVVVTDKDGQSDTKTFGARAYEGQGFVNLK